MRNYEREFVQALHAHVQGLSFDLYDGTQERVVGVAVGKFPPRLPGYPFVLLTPLGPEWEAEVLGGSNRARRTRKVRVSVELHYEHADPETGIYRMSDIFTQLVESLLAQERLLDEERLELIDTDYAYAVSDREGEEGEGPDLVPEWGYKGVAVVTLEAQWRYR